MKELKCALHKDILECVRRRKLLGFTLGSLGIGLLVFISSMLLPKAVEAIFNLAPELIEGADSMQELMEVFFPQDVAGNISLLSSNILVFYVVVVVVLTFRLLPNEYNKGRWELPLSCGYKPGALIWAKALVYGLFSAIPVFVAYILYYLLTAGRLEDNLGFGNALLQAFLCALCIFIIMIYTVLGSALFKHSIVNVVSVLSITLFAPDIFTFFSFEEYLPTYLFTFVKFGYTSYGDIIIPLLELVLLAVLYGILAVGAYQRRHR